MSYIGRGIDQIDNISTLDNLSFNGSDATFNLTQNSVAFVPVSADALQIQIDGVIQSGNYTCSGSQVTFDFTPSGGSVCNGIRHFGVGLLTTVSDSSITTAKLGADSVNGSKIADNSISDEHLDITAITGQTAITSLADTDKFLVSDASDSGNLKYVEKQYLPSGTSTLISTTNISDGTSTVNIPFTGSYELYYVTFTKVCPNTNDNTFRHAFSDDNFSSVNQTLYGAYYRQEARRDNSTSSSTGHQGANGYVRIADHVGEDEYEGIAGIIYYASMKTASPKARYWGNISSHHQDERMSNHMLTGWADETNVMTGVAYNFDSGTFKTGQIKLYGFN